MTALRRATRSARSTRWIDTKIDRQPIHVDFYSIGCLTRPAKAECTTAAYRGLTLHLREQHETLLRPQNRKPLLGSTATPPGPASSAPPPRL